MDDPKVAQMKHDLLWREYRLELRERVERAGEMREPRKRRVQRVPRGGRKLRPETPDEDVRAGRLLPGRASTASLAAIQTTPGNALVNSKQFDGYGSAQAEVGVAMVASHGLAAWNDGQGFYNSRDSQWAAWTADGGATWNPVAIPHPAGAPTWYWFSDPVVAVNPKSGEFFYCGLTQPSSTTNGVSVASGHFSGGSFVWDAAVPVRSGSNSAIFFDKEWMVADSSTGNLYLTYTVFGLSGDSIVFQRSTDGGGHWDDPVVVNQTGAGNVQGARPAVGPNGEVYVVWSEGSTGSSATFDYVRCRRSLTHGTSWDPQTLVANEYSNFGTGAPGFNRERGITFPSIAVDRSTGPHRGRVTVMWNESLNYFDDNIGFAGTRAEVESNDFFSRATSFTPGQHLTGGLTRGDLDYWSFSASQGTSYIFYLQPQVSRLNYTLRVFCGADTVTRLGYSGDPDSTVSTGNNGLIVWTAPTTATYYVRVAQTGYTGNYVLDTGVAAHGSEPGRDQRDVIRATSDNGTTWSASARVNDDAPWFDNWLPEVSVSREGYPYAAWYDWRSSAATCGGSSRIATTRSLDGGATWAPAVAVTDTATNWTFPAANIAPNEGDYINLWCSDAAAALWADGRRGDPDIFSATFPLLGTVIPPPDSAWAAGTAHDFAFTLQQPNPMFANTYHWTVTSKRNWPGFPASGNTASLAAGGSIVHVPVSVPDTAAAGQNPLTLTLSQLDGVVLDSGTEKIAIGAVAGVSSVPAPGLELSGAWPNPASRRLAIAFTLPSAEPASIELIDLAGRRVAVRAVGGLGPGPHTVDFSRDAAGLRPGVYSIRLVQAGRALTRKLVLVR